MTERDAIKRATQRAYWRALARASAQRPAKRSKLKGVAGATKGRR